MDSNISSARTLGQDVRTHSKEGNSASTDENVSDLASNIKTDNVQASISVTNKKLLNASILESALKYEGSIASQPQALLLKTALEGINEALKSLGVDKTIEQSTDEGLDVSPEATADRIVAFSTNFFPLYLKQNPEMEEQEALTKFIDVIAGGIEQGFSEAKEVLTGLNVLEGDVASNIEKTYELVQQGLSNFVDKYKENTSETDNA
jgi:hypothetical protein